MALERFRLYRPNVYQDVQRDPDFDTRYLPQNCGAFVLPCYWVPRRTLHLYQIDNDARSAFPTPDGIDANQRVLFPIHPLEVESFRNFLSSNRAADSERDGLVFWAVPTSSTRTLLVWPDHEPEKAKFVKLSLRSMIFGDRRLTRRKIATSIGHSQLIWKTRAGLPSALGWFFEHVGYVPRSGTDCGVIVRSVPQELIDGRLLIAPLFSLFGGTAEEAPLLLSICRKAGLSVPEFVEDTLCRPFARLWTKLFLQYGLILEAHGQDVLLSLSPDLRPAGQFFYRDFEGLMVDWELRRALGFTDEWRMPYASRWHETYGTWGHPYHQMVSYKLRVSLTDFVYLVLRALARSLEGGPAQREIAAAGLSAENVIVTFWRALAVELNERYGVRVRATCEGRYSMNAFILNLMHARSLLIADSNIVRRRYG